MNRTCNLPYCGTVPQPSGPLLSVTQALHTITVVSFKVKAQTLSKYSCFEDRLPGQLAIGSFPGVRRLGSGVDHPTPYLAVRGRWCNIILLIVYQLSEEKCDYANGSFYDELERVFHNFPNYHIKILLRDSSAKLGTEDIFKPTIGNKSLHQDSNDNGV